MRRTNKIIVIVLIIAIIPMVGLGIYNYLDVTYNKAIELIQSNEIDKCARAKEMLEPISWYRFSKRYISECTMKEKYKYFDFGEASTAYGDFYETHPRVSLKDYNQVERYLSENYSEWYNKKWYDENDNIIEFTPTKLGEREYFIHTIAETAGPVLLISFSENPKDLYTIFFYSEEPWIDTKLYLEPWMHENSVEKIYSTMRKEEFDVQYSQWLEKEIEEQAKVPQYLDSEIIERTKKRVNERLGNGYSGVERIYHSLTVNDSTVEYDWTTRTYFCHISVTYTTNVFDVFGTSSSSYDVTAEYQDLGGELMMVDFNIY